MERNKSIDRKVSVKEVGIELVYGCNLKCRMCPIQQPSSIKYMTIDQLKIILDDLRNIRYRKRLFLVGRGETLLHPELERILFLLEQKQIYKMFKYRYIYTNATVLTLKAIRILCKYNVINELVFSISGQGDKETCEYWMGKNSWRKIVDGINNFVGFYKKNKKHDINYKISAIVPDYSMVPFPPLHQNEIVRNFQNIFSEDMSVVFRSVHDYEGQNNLFPNKKYIKNSCYRLVEGDWNFKVDGSILPCCAVINASEKSIIGNINKSSFQEIYYGKKFQNMKRLLSTNNRDKVEMCKQCTLVSFPEKESNFYNRVKTKFFELKFRLSQLIPRKVKRDSKKLIHHENKTSVNGLNPIDEIKSRIANEPLNEQLHSQLAQVYSKVGNINLAIACYRTAYYLGATVDFGLITQKVPDLLEFPADQYVRFRTVADSVNSRYKGVSVLDVGGGNGLLGYFLPNQKYFLADIDTNGITALPLPFGDNSFDVVCTTDTLEHVPRHLRERFISEIIRVAKKEVHIVVPTMLPSKYPDYNEFFYKVTGAFQTKEHIEYGVPTVEELHLLLKSYNNTVAYKITPCGSLMNIALLLGHYLIDHHKCSRLPEINRYFNKYFYDEMKNGDLPIGHHIRIEKRE